MHNIRWAASFVGEWLGEGSMNRDLARRLNRIERPNEGRTIVLFVYREEDKARQLASGSGTEGYPCNLPCIL